MLFDLRGRGRRRTVQTIYLTLAVLMGGGLVLLRHRRERVGRPVDAVGLTGGGGGGSSANEQLVKQEKAALRRVQANPRDEAALITLTRVRYQQAGQGDNFDQEPAPSRAGRKELAQAAQSSASYLALEPKKPDPNGRDLDGAGLQPRWPQPARRMA